MNRTEAPPFNTIEKIDVIKHKESRLKNNIPVYSINAGTQDVVKIEFIFSAGNWFQSKPLVAAAANALLNSGTTTRTADQLADEIDYYGAYIENDVSKDHATYSLYTLNKHLKTTLSIIEDVIKNSVFPQRDLDLHIQNRKQKYLVNTKKVNMVARKKFAELIFGNHHPYGHNFTITDFDKLQRNDVVTFYNQFYTPGNCKILVAGKIDESLIALLDQHFGHNWEQKQKGSAGAAPSIQTHSNRQNIVYREDAIQSAIRVGRVLFNKRHPDYMGMQVLNTALGGYFGSRLMANIREDKGYTYGIGSAVVSMQHAGYFFISTEVGVDVCAKAIDEINIELKKLRDELIPDGELELVRNYLLGVFIRSVDGPFALADKFKGIMEYGLDYSYYDQFIHTIRTVTSKQLRELANNYLQPGDLLELVVGKK